MYSGTCVSRTDGAHTYANTASPCCVPTQRFRTQAVRRRPISVATSPQNSTSSSLAGSKSSPAFPWYPPSGNCAGLLPSSLPLHIVTALSSGFPPPLTSHTPLLSSTAPPRTPVGKTHPSIERGYTRIPLPATLNPTVRPASLPSCPHPTIRGDRHPRPTVHEHSLANPYTSVNHCQSELAASSNARPTWFIVWSLSGPRGRPATPRSK